MSLNLNIIRNAKISVKLTGIFAIMFSVMLTISSAYILNGVRHYLYTQASKRVEDVNSIIINRLKSNRNLSNNARFFRYNAKRKYICKSYR